MIFCSLNVKTRAIVLLETNILYMYYTQVVDYSSGYEKPPLFSHSGQKLGFG